MGPVYVIKMLLAVLYSFVRLCSAVEVLCFRQKKEMIQDSVGALVKLKLLEWLGGLSGAEVNAVTASWDTVKDNWNPSLGAAFLMKLFTTYPNIRKTFPYGALSDAEIQNNDKFKGHVVNFKAAIQGLVDGLKDEGTLKKNIDKLADDHIKRNVTDMTDFINAFNLLAAFLVENGASGGDAWKKALSDVSAALAAAFKSKGK